MYFSLIHITHSKIHTKCYHKTKDPKFKLQSQKTLMNETLCFRLNLKIFFNSKNSQMKSPRRVTYIWFNTIFFSGIKNKNKLKQFWTFGVLNLLIYHCSAFNKQCCKQVGPPKLVLRLFIQKENKIAVSLFILSFY